MKLDTESWQTHKKQQFCRCCSLLLERFSRHVTQAHLLTTLKKKSNGAMNCGSWTLNLGKPTKSNSFVAVVVRL